eukprot:9138554-Pyramimonas_sp.AAC.1
MMHRVWLCSCNDTIESTGMGQSAHLVPGAQDAARTCHESAFWNRGIPTLVAAVNRVPPPASLVFGWGVLSAGQPVSGG